MRSQQAKVASAHTDVKEQNIMQEMTTSIVNMVVVKTEVLNESVTDGVIC